eukprot:maker-scaffold_3-snap-gene-15.23-mRNA-1 protein AED:0.01 eAED:0.01 QI:1415/1/1/1/0/0/3/96/232
MEKEKKEIPKPSLVCYNTPVLINNQDEKLKLEQESKDSAIMNKILPPREWTDDKKNLWIQYVCQTPATKTEVIQLQNALDEKLENNGAKEVGLCPVREAIYKDCFDEIIRQVAVDCVERGQLLYRVKKDVDDNVRDYFKLYESATAFGIRKALFMEQQKLNLEQNKENLEKELEQLTIQVNELNNKEKQLEEKFKENQLKEDAAHKEEVTELQEKIDTCKANLEALLASPRK